MKSILNLLIILFSVLLFSCKDKNPAVADFTYDTTSIATGECQLTTLNSSIDASSYSWKLTKNGKEIASSSEANPIFTIVNNGKYQLTLYAQNKKSNGNSKTVDIEITNAGFGEAKGPNNPDLLWSADEFKAEYNGDRIYFRFYKDYNSSSSNYNEYLAISLPISIIEEGKIYDVTTTQTLGFDYNNYPLNVRTSSQEVGHLTITKYTNSYIEGTFFFTIKDWNNKQWSFNNGKFKAILPVK